MNDEAMQSALTLAREWDAKAIGTGMPHVYYEAQTLARALLRSEAVASRWVPTTERHPDKDGRLWAILTERRENGKHTGYIPMYEYYHFIDGWATDEHVTHWLETDLHPLPGVPK